MQNNVINTILYLIKEKGITEKECLKTANINTSFLTDWKNGRIKTPSYDKIVKLAEALNVSTDYILLGKKVDDLAYNLTETEKNLIKNYRKLDERGKAKIVSTAYEEVDRMEKYGDTTTA